MEDFFELAGKKYHSRLIVGTGKYKDFAETKRAIEVPLAVMKLCERALPLVERVAEKGNQNSISDAGVAALVLGAAASGAHLNVLINLPGLTDASYAKDTKANAEKLRTLVEKRSAAAAAAVAKSL